MTKSELINHLGQVIATAHSENAKETVNHLLDLCNLLKPPTK